MEPRRKRSKRIEELLLRWRDEPPLVAGKLTLDARVFEAFLDGQPCELTAHEFAILFYVAKAQRRVTRAELATAIWASEPPRPRSIGHFLTTTRRKLERLDPDNEYLHGLWGEGYLFELRSRPGTS